jgi:hypothetical protein
VARLSSDAVEVEGSDAAAAANPRKDEQHQRHNREDDENGPQHDELPSVTVRDAVEPTGQRPQGTAFSPRYTRTSQMPAAPEPETPHQTT